MALSAISRLSSVVRQQVASLSTISTYDLTTEPQETTEEVTLQQPDRLDLYTGWSDHHYFPRPFSERQIVVEKMDGWKTIGSHVNVHKRMEFPDGKFNTVEHEQVTATLELSHSIHVWTQNTQDKTVHRYSTCPLKECNTRVTLPQQDLGPDFLGHYGLRWKILWLPATWKRFGGATHHLIRSIKGTELSVGSSIVVKRETCVLNNRWPDYSAFEESLFQTETKETIKGIFKTSKWLILGTRQSESRPLNVFYSHDTSH